MKDGTYFTDLETYLCDHAAGRKTITRLSTQFDLEVLHRPMVNDVVAREDFVLPFNQYEVINEEDLTAQAEELAGNLVQLSNLTESYGGSYYYMTVPCQYAYFPEKYPWYMNNRSEFVETAGRILQETLQKYGVNFKDLGNTFRAEGWPKEYGSTVDNHFSIFGAFSAYRAILEEINQKDGAQIPILQREDFTFEPVENNYMGSRIRKLFNLVKSDEHLYRAVPNVEVPFTRTDYGNTVASTVYQTIPNSGEPVAYGFYMGGDIANTEIRTNRSQLPTILLYGDSFTNAVECILYLSCDTMYSIDLRHYTEQTLSEFIQETQPDYVVCLRDYSAMLVAEGNGGI